MTSASNFGVFSRTGIPFDIKILVSYSFLFLHVNPSNYTLCRKMCLSRFNLDCVDCFRAFFLAYRALLAKIKLFLSKYLKLFTITHNFACLFSINTSIRILLMSLLPNIQFDFEMSSVACCDQNIRTHIFRV